MVSLRYLTRLWYYFRTGYLTYFIFVLGAVNTLAIVYGLLIQSVPPLKQFFTSVVVFAVFAASVGVPSAITVGWLHLKKSPAYASEVDIAVEANPYYYKLPPGYHLTVYAPVYLETVRLLRKILSNRKQLDSKSAERLNMLEARLEHLIRGGWVGQPRVSWRGAPTATQVSGGL